MKKSIILFESLNNSKTIYDFLLENKYDKIYNIRFVKTNKLIRYKSIFDKLFTFFKMTKQIGILTFIKLLLFKKSIIIAGSVGKFQDIISKKRIHVNHGWGTKKTPGNNQENDAKLFRTYNNIFSKTAYIICLSNFDSTYFLNHKKLKKIQIPTFMPLGNPRNDYLFKNKDNKENIIRIENKLNITKTSSKTVILYAPTHRESDIKNKNLSNRIFNEFKEIDSELENKNIILLFRPHHYDDSLKNKICQFKNIIYVGSDKFSDERSLMIYSDILITDYSSIFVDYLLLQKPIIFYTFDLEPYSKYRGVVIDYTNPLHTPGPKINLLSEILNLTEKDFKKYDLNASANFFHKYRDGKSTERLVALIDKELKNMK